MSRYKIILFFLFGFQLTFSQSAPVANNDSYEVERNTLLTIEAPGVLENDTDENGDSLTVTGYSVNGITYAANETVTLSEAVLTINENGSFVFEPAQDFIGDVPSILYTISDETFTASATVDINVFLPPVAPIANNDNYEVERNTVFIIEAPGILENDTDENGDPITVTGYTVNGITYAANEMVTSSEGVLTINENGSFVFEPTQDFIGEVPLILYTISDETFTTSATVDI
uniref:Ig-like domain-containing protein n=1 Tax=Polaribacter sp. TaxID=1920175 RepID=UPI003F6A05D2